MSATMLPRVQESLMHLIWGKVAAHLQKGFSAMLRAQDDRCAEVEGIGMTVHIFDMVMRGFCAAMRQETILRNAHAPQHRKEPTSVVKFRHMLKEYSAVCRVTLGDNEDGANANGSEGQSAELVGTPPAGGREALEVTLEQGKSMPSGKQPAASVLEPGEVASRNKHDELQQGSLRDRVEAPAEAPASEYGSFSTTH